MPPGTRRGGEQQRERHNRKARRINGYQVIGFSKRIEPHDILKKDGSANTAAMSDGAIFRTKEEARAYGAARMHPGFSVKEIPGIKAYINEAGVWRRVCPCCGERDAKQTTITQPHTVCDQCWNEATKEETHVRN